MPLKFIVERAELTFFRIRINALHGITEIQTVLLALVGSTIPRYARDRDWTVVRWNMAPQIGVTHRDLIRCGLSLEDVGLDVKKDWFNKPPEQFVDFVARRRREGVRKRT